MNVQTPSQKIRRTPLLGISLLLSMMVLLLFTNPLRADDGAQSELQADRNGKDDDKQDSERYTDANLENSSFSVNKSEAEIDDVLQYTAIISNSGGNYSVVSVSDLLPTTVDYVTGSLTSNLPNPISSTVNGDEIFWQAAINPNTEIIITFEAKINATAPISQYITNTLMISATNIITGLNPIMLPVSTFIISPSADLVLYLPIIFQAIPAPSLAVGSLPNSNNEFSIDWSVPDLSDIVGFDLQHANNPEFNNATTENLGVVTQSNQNPAAAFNPFHYYRVRSRIGSRTSAWSNVVFVVGAYEDQMGDNTSGWTMRREDTDDINNDRYYSGGRYVIRIGGRWDYQLVSPLVPTPSENYVLESRARLSGQDNLHVYGFVLNGDWNGGSCPTTDFSTCFNQYYRVWFLWNGSDETLKMEVKKITHHDPDSNAGRGEDLITFVAVPVATPSEGYQTYRVEMTGGTIKVYVNNALVGTVTDNNPLTGRYFGGIAATNEYGGSNTEYDWVKVTPQ